LFQVPDLQYLVDGDLIKRGAAFSATVQAPKQAGGKVAFLQVLLSQDCKLVSPHGNVLQNWHGISGVDINAKVNPDPPLYGNPKTVNSNQSVTLTANDQPYLELLPEDEDDQDNTLSVKTGFALYLMYQAPGSSSIWVTLGLAPWNWNASAMWNGTQWTLGDQPSPAVTYGINTSQLPTWNAQAGGCASGQPN